MEIKFEIPDFIPDSRIIYIIAGSHELIGYIEPNTRKIWIKTRQCSRCGECCKKIECPDLIFKDGLWACNKEGGMPFICVVNKPKIEGCTVRWAVDRITHS